MLIQNGTGRKKGYGAQGDHRTPYAFAGWNDAQAGRPFNYGLVDRATRAEGIAYERSRAIVLAMLQRGESVPNWRTSITVPPRVRQAMGRFKEEVITMKGTPDAVWPIGKPGWLSHNGLT